MSATPYQTLLVNAKPLKAVKIDTEHQFEEFAESNHVLPDGYLLIVQYTDSDDDVVSYQALTDGATIFNALPKLGDSSLEARIAALEAV